jgi:Domain of unknown function (DUF4279)
VTNEGEVYFALYGDEFDPDDVTNLIGLEPTTTKRKGSPIPKFTSWAISTGKLENDVIDVYDMSSALVSKLSPHAAKIIEAKRQFGLEATLQVVLRITTDATKSTPAIGFEREVISFLNSVGASIDVDTYRNAP